MGPEEQPPAATLSGATAQRRRDPSIELPRRRCGLEPAKGGGSRRGGRPRSISGTHAAHTAGTSSGAQAGHTPPRMQGSRPLAWLRSQTLAAAVNRKMEGTFINLLAVHLHKKNDIALHKHYLRSKNDAETMPLLQI